MDSSIKGKKPAAGQGTRAVSPAEVKLCELCGALNYHANAECFVCAWRGAFARDGDPVRLAWERLRGEYGTVTLLLVTTQRHARPALGELGVARPVGLRGHLRQWWQGFQAARDRRAAEREARLRPSRRSSRPGGLGV